MTPRGARVRAAAVAGALAALVLLPAAPASAHAYLTDSTPKAGSTLTAAPASVVLEFDETLLDLGSDAVTVTGPRGKHYETGCAAVDGRDVTTAVALGAAGTYTVTYRVVSADGHTVESDYAFEYAPTGAAGSAGSTAGPGCAAAAPTAPGATAGTPVVVFAAIGVSAAVLLAVLVLIVVIAVRIRRTPAGPDEQ